MFHGFLHGHNVVQRNHSHYLFPIPPSLNWCSCYCWRSSVTVSLCEHNPVLKHTPHNNKAIRCDGECCVSTLMWLMFGRYVLYFKSSKQIYFFITGRSGKQGSRDGRAVPVFVLQLMSRLYFFSLDTCRVV